MKILLKSNSVKNHQCIMPSSLAVFLSAKYFGCSTHNNLIQNPRSAGYLHILGSQINTGEREGDNWEIEDMLRANNKEFE